MEIKQLEYFAAAVEYGSLNRAAEKLYTTQPNVSRVLNSLEKELHVTLLERSNKGIKMTPQAKYSFFHVVLLLSMCGGSLHFCNPRLCLFFAGITIPWLVQTYQCHFMGDQL